MARKKKRTGLPRVTVLAYNRRELAAFVQSVENLRLLVEDLRPLVTVLSGLASSKVRSGKRKGTSSPTSASPAAPAAPGREGGAP